MPFIIITLYHSSHMSANMSYDKAILKQTRALFPHRCLRITIGKIMRNNVAQAKQVHFNAMQFKAAESNVASSRKL